MSRTDKTRPWWVKLLESPSNYKDVHNHGKVPLRDEHGEIVRVLEEGAKWPRIVYTQAASCDLPPDPWKDQGEYSSCHWTYTTDFISQARYCGCRGCSDYYGRKEDRERERRDGKRQAREWRREYE